MKTIALVEDNEDNVLLIRALLGSSYHLQEHTTGISAITSIIDSPPDLVLMDISLPDMSGTEVLQKLRKKKHLTELPVIAFTAHAMAGDREKFLAAGFDFYITKPILSLGQLVDPIEKLIAKKNDASPAEKI